MKAIVLILASAAFLAGQPRQPNAAGVAFGFWHVLSADPAVDMKFWQSIGGAKAGKNIQFPGVVIEFEKTKPSDGTAGEVINHGGLWVKNLAETKAKWEAAGIKIEPNPTAVNFFVVAPNGMRVEIYENKDLTEPMSSHHTHFMGAKPLEMQAWYVQRFGAVAGKRGAAETAQIPGMELAFGLNPAPMAPTKGRALDHIGFAVKDLPGLAKKLEGSGVKLAPIKKGRTSFTDPWGTTVELVAVK